MSDGRVKKKIQTKELTPEEKQQRLERIRGNRKVRSLFDEQEKIYGKKIYMPRVPELLKFLRLKKNAKAFWECPHIKMVYNISGHHNFLLSIYAEETDNRKYEKWMREHFSNPFIDKVIINFEKIQNHFKISDSDKNDLFNFFLDLINPEYNTVGYERFKRELMDKHEKIVSKYRLMKYVPLDSLLDRDYYQDLIKTVCQLPKSIRNAQGSIQYIDKMLNEIHMLLSAEEIDFLKISRYFLTLFYTFFSIKGLFQNKDYSSPERTSLIRETSEEYKKLLFDDPMYEYDLNKAVDDDYFDKKYKFFVERYNNLSNLNNRYRNEVEMIARESADKVLFLHPLIAMDNNFIRIDEYSVWKRTRAKQWSDIRKNNPDMFAVLDALVKSRKYYLDEINQDKEDVGCQE